MPNNFHLSYCQLEIKTTGLHIKHPYESDLSKYGAHVEAQEALIPLYKIKHN